jgi:hypothetical protein
MPSKPFPGPRPPWLTVEGYVDPAELPIEPYLAQAVSEDEEKSRNGIGILRMMQQYGRVDAGVFLLGFFVNAPDDWEKRIRLVEALNGFRTEGCARVLFGELKRVKSSNTTRIYLGEVIKALSRFPPELVQAGFEELADDQSFSYRMRDKFHMALDQALHRGRGEYF